MTPGSKLQSYRKRSEDWKSKRTSMRNDYRPSNNRLELSRKPWKVWTTNQWLFLLWSLRNFKRMLHSSGTSYCRRRDTSSRWNISTKPMVKSSASRMKKSSSWPRKQQSLRIPWIRLRRIVMHWPLNWPIRRITIEDLRKQRENKFHLGKSLPLRIRSMSFKVNWTTPKGKGSKTKRKMSNSTKRIACCNHN